MDNDCTIRSDDAPGRHPRPPPSTSSPAERRVVEAVLDDPERVAFGTVAELARRSETSGPTVVRVARKLGYEGYRGLQAAAQAEITGDLAPAAERIRRTAGAHDDPLGRALAVELANVEATLDAGPIRRPSPAPSGCSPTASGGSW